MSLVAEYAIGCEHLPFVAVARRLPAATLEVDIVATAEDETPFVVDVTGVGAEEIEAVFDEVRFVGEYRLAGATDESLRYKVTPAVSMAEQLGDHVDDLAALRGLASTDSVIDLIRVTPTGWIQRGWFADRETLDEFRTFWQRNTEFTLRHLAADDGEKPGRGLTDAQREALLTAHEMGYFAIPRTASLADVAAELDISASSCSERLRRAHQHLVENGVESRSSSTVRADRQ